VAISYLSEERDARETEDLVAEAGRKAILLPGNIGEAKIAESVAWKAIEGFGTIDALSWPTAERHSGGNAGLHMKIALQIRAPSGVFDKNSACLPATGAPRAATKRQRASWSPPPIESTCTRQAPFYT
jgi:hypothetical protein